MRCHRPDVRAHGNLVVPEPGRPEETGSIGIGTCLQEHMGRSHLSHLLHHLVQSPGEEVMIGVVHGVQVHLGGPDGNARRIKPAQLLPLDPAPPIHHHPRDVPRAQVLHAGGNAIEPQGHREPFLRSDGAGHRVVSPVRPGEHLDVVLGYDPPEGARIRGADGLSFVNDSGAPMQQWSIYNIGVADNPANIGSCPVHITRFDVVDIFHAPFKSDKVPSIIADNTFGHASGA